MVTVRDVIGVNREGRWRDHSVSGQERQDRPPQRCRVDRVAATELRVHTQGAMALRHSQVDHLTPIEHA